MSRIGMTTLTLLTLLMTGCMAAVESEYGFSEAGTTYGILGVKVWIYTGDSFHI